MLRAGIVRVVVACLALIVDVDEARAQVIPMSFGEMVEVADSIVVAEAVDSRAEWVTTGSSRVIVTRVTFRVSDTLKGVSRMLLPLEFLGGTVGDRRQQVSGVPTFELGDQAVLFVTGERAISPIVGHMQGRFPINVSPDGQQFVTLPDRRAFSAVDQSGSPVTVSPTPIPTMRLGAFLDEIERLVITP